MDAKYLLIVPLSLVLTGCLNQATKNKVETAPIPTVDTQPSPTVMVATGSGLASPSATPTKAKITNEEKVMQSATIKTSKGDITVKLYPEAAPKTVENFTAKAKSDYYKNLTFHRVEDWVIQGGDPLGTGTGGGKMPTELSQVPFKEGSLGVARGQDIKVSNDSQFFICTADCAWLTGQYTIFGEVTEGMDVAKKMAVGDKILSVTVE